MGRGFLVLGVVEKALVETDGDRPATLAHFVSYNPEFQYRGIDLSANPHPSLGLIARVFGLRDNPEVAPATIIADGKAEFPQGLRAWYAQFLFEAISLWEIATDMRNKTGQYTTVFPKPATDFESYQRQIGEIAPQLRMHQGRIQRTPIYRTEINSTIDRIISDAHAGIPESLGLIRLKALFPLESSEAQRITTAYQNALSFQTDTKRSFLEDQLHKIKRKHIR